MAARGIVVILLTTLLAPMVSAQVESSVDYGYGAVLSDNPEAVSYTHLTLPTRS